MASAREHPNVVAEYLREECAKGRATGHSEVAAQVKQISKFGVIPKGRTPEKWQLIVNLSATRGK